LCINLAPEANLLKNFRSKLKFDHKEVKRFIFLIVIPAPKPIPRPKKEPEEKVKAKTESSMKIKRAELAKTPEPSAEADKFLPPKDPDRILLKIVAIISTALFFINSLDVEEKF
jgi:hypothetical protein